MISGLLKNPDVHDVGLQLQQDSRRIGHRGALVLYNFGGLLLKDS